MGEYGVEQWGWNERRVIWRIFKGHQWAITFLVGSQDGKYLFGGCEDGSILQWPIEG